MTVKGHFLSKKAHHDSVLRLLMINGCRIQRLIVL